MRRIIETALIVLISSALLYFFIILGVVPGTARIYTVSFGISALVFLILNGVALYRHFWAINFDIRKYLIVNISIFAVLAVLNYLSIYIAFKCDFYHIDTALFGYAKALRQIFDVFGISEISAAYWSASVIWILYIGMIFAVIVGVLRFDGRYNDFLQQQEEMDELDENYNYGE